MSIDMVAEHRGHCLHRHLSDCPSRVQGLGQFLRASELALDRRKTELNWVELGAVWRKKDDVDTSGLANEFDLLASVYRSVI